MTDALTTSRGLKKGAEAAKAAATSSGFNRASYFKLQDGERAFVQFITDWDEWLNAVIHSMVPSKPRPSDWTGDNWPAKVMPVCRYTPAGDDLPLFDDCYVCDNIPDPNDSNKPFKKVARTYALGVILEEVIGDGSPEKGGKDKLGRRVGFKIKKTTQVNPETKVEEEAPDVQIFTFGWSNFFQALEGAAQVNDYTICNLAFAIQRNGKGLDTKYTITSMGLQPRDFRDASHLAKVGITLENGNKVYPKHLNLEDTIMHRASDDFYATYIDPTKSPKKSSQGTQGSQAASAPKPVVEAEPEELKAMRDRLLSYGSVSTDAPSSAAPEVESSAPALADYDD